MRSLLLLPLLGGCWLGNDFSPFEHDDRDGGMLVDLSANDQSASSDGAMTSDGAVESDASMTRDGSVDMPPPGDMSTCYPAWAPASISNTPKVVGATLVTVPDSHRLFLVGGCTTQIVPPPGPTCTAPSSNVYELTVDVSSGAASWSALKFPKNTSFTEVDAAGGSLDGNDFFTIGSSTSTAEVDFDVGVSPPTATASTREFSTGTPVPPGVAATTIPRSGAATNDDVWAVGGRSPQMKPLATTYSLSSPAASTWSAGPDLTTARSSAALVLYGPPTNGQLWAIGGLTAMGATTSVEMLGLTTATSWTSSSDIELVAARSNLAAVVAPDNQIYAIGGLGASGALSSVEVSSGGGFTTMCSSLGAANEHVTAGIGPDNRIYVVSATNSVGSPTMTVDAYGPIVTVTPGSGGSFTLNGSGFVPGANILVYGKSGQAGSTFKADANGALGANGAGITVTQQSTESLAYTVSETIGTTEYYPARFVYPAQ